MSWVIKFGYSIAIRNELLNVWIQYMHEQNIMHRDLKTQNIFLTKSRVIKVGDLGIARQVYTSLKHS